MKREYLYYIAAIIWGIPGVIISIKGISAYFQMCPGNLWWLLLITAGVIAGFYFMFSRIVDKYSTRIASLPAKTSFWQTFPLKGGILVVGMSCLGIALKFVPGIPMEFTASFYSGLGPMLVVAAARFIYNRFSNEL